MGQIKAWTNAEKERQKTKKEKKKEKERKEMKGKRNILSTVPVLYISSSQQKEFIRTIKEINRELHGLRLGGLI